MARILVVDDSPTIRKVVTGILERHGYETVAAADGQLALDVLGDDAQIDLVLLDFVMPKMNGFQFCRVVRSSEKFASMPVVLMSAKSDKIRDQFVEQTGALDAISKPFDAQALVVAIENALRRVNQGRVSQARLPVDADDLDPFAPPGSSSPSVDEEATRARATALVGAKLGAALGPILAKLAPGAVGDRAQIASALTHGMSFDTLLEVIRSIRGVDVGEGTLALSGDVGIIPIGAVLQMLQVESQTGLIVVSNGKSEVTIVMRSGLIDLVQSRGAGDEFRLGRFFVEEGLVTPEEIDLLLKDHPHHPQVVSRTRSAEIRALEAEGSKLVDDSSRASRPSYGDRASHVERIAHDRTSGERSSSIPPPMAGMSGLLAFSERTSGARMLLGDVLVQSGRVTQDQLKGALARQSSELVYEVLRWPSGQFEFRVQPSPPLAQKAQLGLPVASVVMEGFRRVDEWRLVEAGLGNFESVLVRDPVAIDALPPGLEGGGLSRQEQVVLGTIDGERTVREIIAASHMSSFDACRILMQFLEARLVRRRHG